MVCNSAEIKFYSKGIDKMCAYVIYLVKVVVRATKILRKGGSIVRDITGKILTAKESMEFVENEQKMNELLDSKTTLGSMVELFTDDFPLSMNLVIMNSESSGISLEVQGKSCFICVPDDFAECRVVSHSNWNMAYLNEYMPFYISADIYGEG